ncbi:sigma factor-like helix-turn-helix DNA-binding protein, partial [Alienimonas chondri]|uniref:sigma-70 region 4 domain-containing protein n=1 Tax=Alienimonas chondri TaxID=2681879 RepID=UPI001487CE01
RDALVLKHVEGFTYAQIAERLGVSVHCVEDRLRRGRGRLRRAVRPAHTHVAAPRALPGAVRHNLENCRFVDRDGRTALRARVASRSPPRPNVTPAPLWPAPH